MSFNRTVIHTFVKPDGNWRIPTSPDYFDKLAELRREFPSGELIGGIHDDKQEFVIEVYTEDVVETVDITMQAKTVVTYATLQVNSRKYAVIQSVVSQGGIPEFTIHSYHKSNSLALDEIKRLMTT